MKGVAVDGVRAADGASPAERQAENVQDMVRKGRFDRRGERNNSARLTWPVVREIRAAYAAGARVDCLAAQHGISKSQVRNIIHHHHWRESTVLTVQQAIDTFSVDVDPHLDRQTQIPVISGLQFQGDVAVIPAPTARAAKTPVPVPGYPVVRGEVGGNTHLLLGAGRVFFDLRTTGDLDLGVLTVPDGSTAYLAHPEHSYAGIGPGTYVIRRQREQADEIRMVAD